MVHVMLMTIDIELCGTRSKVVEKKLVTRRRMEKGYGRQRAEDQ